MARQNKRTYKVYTAWNYQMELEDLNKASAQGWQLIKGGCFSEKFKWNPEVCYRYQLDYPGKVEDMGRYIETFREQGWEYVSATFNGWYYFRKLYDPSFPEEQYEIFTDRSSLKEMNNRWAKLAMVLTACIAVFMLVCLIQYLMFPKLPSLVQTLALACILAVFIRGIYIMKIPERRKNLRWDSALFFIGFAVFIGGSIGALVLEINRPHFNSVLAGDEMNSISAAADQALEWHNLEIAYSDNYYIDLEITAESPICFSIRNKSGEIAYTAEGSSVTEESVRLNLEAGAYTVLLSDFAGGPLNISFEID